MLDRHKLVNLLRTLAQIVESSSDEELEALKANGLSHLLAGKPMRHKKVDRKIAQGSVPVDVNSILESLRHAESREVGFSVLERHQLDKRSLESIARHMDLPVLREDTSRRLIEKIVEGSVGSRLSSTAIRGVEE